jgi:hypothetical protein
MGGALVRLIICVFVGVVAALVPVRATPQLKDPPRPALYGATAVGTECVYSYKAGIDISRVKRKIVAAESRDGGILISTDREWEEKPAPLWLLKCPVVRGQSWELPREGWDPPLCT